MFFFVSWDSAVSSLAVIFADLRLLKHCKDLVPLACACRNISLFFISVLYSDFERASDYAGHENLRHKKSA